MDVSCMMILHYGVDYIPYAIRSVYDSVGEIVVVYTPHPSHGHQSGMEPPESRDDVLAAVFKHDPDRKINWHETGNFWYEGQHRDFALSLCKGDLTLVVDCDEVWHKDVLDQALLMAFSENKAREWLVNFTSPWRSFSWICTDNMWPVRIIDKRHKAGTAYVPKELGPIYHFGYSIRSTLMSYKIGCHGHAAEWMPNWFTQKWSAWPPVPDCHPTCRENTWVPERFDKMLLPELMRDHPFWDLEPIP